MQTILLRDPNWIQYREKVLGDVVSNTGVINTEGVANRPGKAIYTQFEACSDIQLGTDINTIHRISFADKLGRGEDHLLVNCAYIVAVDGKLTLKLPKTDLSIGAKVRITKGDGLLSNSSTVLIQGVYDGSGYKIGEEENLLLGAGTLNFDLVLIFNGSTWVALSQVGSADNTTIKSRPATSVHDDDYLIVYTPNGESYKFELEQLLEYISARLTRANTSRYGVVRLATEAELKSGIRDENAPNCDAVVPTINGIKTEVTRFLNSEYLPIRDIGDVQFVTSKVGKPPYYQSDKIVRQDVFIINTNDDLNRMAQLNPVPKVYNMNDKACYNYDRPNNRWVKSGSTIGTDVPNGRIYYNWVTRKLFFVDSPDSVIELSSSLDINEVQNALGDNYVKKGTKVNGHALGGDITVNAGDIPDLYNLIHNMIADALNCWKEDPNELMIGATRWTGDGRLMSWTGSSWVLIYPATWGA